MSDHKADTHRPYKALVAALAAALAVLQAEVGPSLPAWANVLLAILLAGLATYAMPNPATPAGRRRRGR